MSLLLNHKGKNYFRSVFIIVFIIFITGMSFTYFYAKDVYTKEKVVNEYSNTKALHISPIHQGEYIYGSSTAQSVIVEYYDLECPYCRDLHKELSKNDNLFVTIGYIYRPFPLTYIHGGAAEKNLALLCASEQNQSLFIKGMDYAYSDIEQRPTDYEDYLLTKVPYPDAFKNCVGKFEFRQVINDSVSDGRTGGVYGTPTLVYLYNNVPLQIFHLVGARQGVALIKALTEIKKNK